jgi:hypothetical protein
MYITRKATASDLQQFPPPPLIIDPQQSFSAFENMQSVKHTLDTKSSAQKKTLKHFSYFAGKDTIPSFNVPIWEPACFTFAFPFSPAIVCHLSRMHGRILNLAWTLVDIK